MKNLVVERDQAWRLPLEEDEEATCIACNAAEACGYLATAYLDVLCVAFQDGSVRDAAAHCSWSWAHRPAVCTRLAREEAASLLCLQVMWRAALGATGAGGPDSRVQALAYSLEMDAVVAGLSTGELLLINCSTHEVVIAARVHTWTTVMRARRADCQLCVARCAGAHGRAGGGGWPARGRHRHTVLEPRGRRAAGGHGPGQTAGHEPGDARQRHSSAEPEPAANIPLGMGAALR